MLFSGFAAFMGIWNYGMFDNYMTTRLYKLEQFDKDTRQVKDTFKQSDFMKPARLQNPKEYLRETCPSWLTFCKCFKPNREERGFLKARERLQGETNIVEIIKSRRYFNAALRFLLSK